MPWQGYDPELFSKALPCLSAIGCALSPDYSLSNQDDGYYNRCVAEASWTYDPAPVDTSRYVIHSAILPTKYPLLHNNPLGETVANIFAPISRCFYSQISSALRHGQEGHLSSPGKYTRLDSLQLQPCGSHKKNENRYLKTRFTDQIAIAIPGLRRGTFVPKTPDNLVHPPCLPFPGKNAAGAHASKVV